MTTGDVYCQGCGKPIVGGESAYFKSAKYGGDAALSNGPLCYVCFCPQEASGYDVSPLVVLGEAVKGWVCPKCERVYSPVIPECSSCNTIRTYFSITAGDHPSAEKEGK